MDVSFYPTNQPPLDQRHTVGRFKDEVVVSAGGASGIGFAAAHRFANDGGKVAILDINKSAGRSAASYINSKSFTGTAKYYFVDVTNPQSCQKAISELVEDFGKDIHHVVNTATYFGSKGM